MFDSRQVVALAVKSRVTFNLSSILERYEDLTLICSLTRGRLGFLSSVVFNLSKFLGMRLAAFLPRRLSKAAQNKLAFLGA